MDRQKQYKEKENMDYITLKKDEIFFEAECCGFDPNEGEFKQTKTFYKFIFPGGYVWRLNRKTGRITERDFTGEWREI